MSFIFCPSSRYRDEIRILKSWLRVAWPCSREADGHHLCPAGRIPHYRAPRDEGHAHWTNPRDEKPNGGRLQQRAHTDPERMAFRRVAKRRRILVDR